MNSFNNLLQNAAGTIMATSDPFETLRQQPLNNGQASTPQNRLTTTSTAAELQQQ